MVPARLPPGPARCGLRSLLAPLSCLSGGVSASTLYLGLVPNACHHCSIRNPSRQLPAPPPLFPGRKVNTFAPNCPPAEGNLRANDRRKFPWMQEETCPACIMGGAPHGWALCPALTVCSALGLEGSTSASRAKTPPSESPEPVRRLPGVAEGLCRVTRSRCAHTGSGWSLVQWPVTW